MDRSKFPTEAGVAHEYNGCWSIFFGEKEKKDIISAGVLPESTRIRTAAEADRFGFGRPGLIIVVVRRANE